MSIHLIIVADVDLLGKGRPMTQRENLLSDLHNRYFNKSASYLLQSIKLLSILISCKQTIH